MHIFCKIRKLFCFVYLQHHKDQLEVVIWVKGLLKKGFCASLVAVLFLFCYERDFMKDLSSVNQADVIKAFNSTSRY